MNISKSVLNWYENIKKYRQDLHKIPELAYMEFETKNYILDKLLKFGYTPKQILDTGLTAFLDVGAKTTFAFRADIDALPLEELTALNFASLNKGVMHACGHDGHIAILLALAGYIMEHKNKLKHNVLLIFQPAEEGGGGSIEMIKNGVLQNPKVDYIFSSHLSPSYEQGSINISKSVAFAADYSIDIIIKGKSSHAAAPHEGIDTVTITAQLINILQTIVSRKNNPENPLIITVGTVRAGTKRNIIASTSTLECTIRAFDTALAKNAIKEIRQISSGLGLATNSKIEVIEKLFLNPVINSPEAVKIIQSVVHNDEITIIKPLAVAEDFFAYLDHIPGAMFLIGTKNEKSGHIHALHSAYFNFDEKALLSGLEVYRRILFE